MPIGKLRSARNDFESEIQSAENLAAQASSWTTTGSEYEALLELAFLKAYIAWEVFVERAFYLYAQGYSAPNGSRAARYVRPIDDEHVSLLLQPAPMRYVDWTVPEAIRSRARAFFENGEPFETALASSTFFLQNMKKIRNAIAHSSSDAIEKYESFATTALGRPCRDLRPGGFLLEMVPGATGNTYFSEFWDQFRTLAYALVP